MKMTLLNILLICFVAPSFAQKPDSVIFDKDTYMESGIYTEVDQLKTNSPKYYNYKTDYSAFKLLSENPAYNYYDNQGEHIKYRDTLFAYSEGGELVIYYKKWWRKLITKGAICTFFVDIHSGMETIKLSYMYYFDFNTGKIGYVPNNQERLDRLFKRDSELYNEFSSLSKSKKKKQYFSYILRYNERNPIYIKKANP